MWKLYTSLKNCLGTFDTVEKLEEHVNSNSQLDKFSLIVETPDGQILRYATPADMEINYQVMTVPAADGKYYPDYETLLAGATCEEEAQYINEVKKVISLLLTIWSISPSKPADTLKYFKRHRMNITLLELYLSMLLNTPPREIAPVVFVNGD